MKDIVLDDSLDLEIVDGDFVVADSGQQHINLLLLTHKGEWKQTPYCGIGIAEFLNEDNVLEMRKTIRIQLRSDGAKVQSIKYENEKLEIKATYG